MLPQSSREALKTVFPETRPFFRHKLVAPTGDQPRHQLFRLSLRRERPPERAFEAMERVFSVGRRSKPQNVNSLNRLVDVRLERLRVVKEGLGPNQQRTGSEQISQIELPRRPAQSERLFGRNLVVQFGVERHQFFDQAFVQGWELLGDDCNQIGWV